MNDGEISSLDRLLRFASKQTLFGAGDLLRYGVQEMTKLAIDGRDRETRGRGIGRKLDIRRRDPQRPLDVDSRRSIAWDECCAPGRSKLLSGTVGPGASVAFRHRPQSGALLSFFVPVDRRGSARTGIGRGASRTSRRAESGHPVADSFPSSTLPQGARSSFRS